jgi:heat shock protein HslJ
LELVEHLSYDDQNMADPPVIQAGIKFRKGWRIRNTGTCPWDPRYSVVFADGNHVAARMGGAPVVLHGRTAPSETYDVQVDLVAPREPGLYQGYWQMRNAQGVYLDVRLPVAIQVPPLPKPTTTGTPQLPTTIEFDVDPNRVVGGECAVLSWNATQTQAVYLYKQGQAWQAYGVPFSGRRTACPDQTTTYVLRVVRASGWIDFRQLVLHVEQPSDAPQIARFRVEPGDHVSEGGCVVLRWEVKGLVTDIRILRNGSMLWGDGPLSGSLPDCPPGRGTLIYTIEATGPGGIAHAQWPIRIGPTAQSLSDTGWQILAIGGALPAPSPRAPTLLFGTQNATGHGTVSGWSGCNSYRGTYHQDDVQLTVDSLVAGTETCDAGVMVQEENLLNALYATATLGWSEGQLTLWNSGDQVVLNLALSESAAP